MNISNNNILLMGCGNIGVRHLYAIREYVNKKNIFVLEKNQHIISHLESLNFNVSSDFSELSQYNFKTVSVTMPVHTRTDLMTMLDELSFETLVIEKPVNLDLSYINKNIYAPYIYFYDLKKLGLNFQFLDQIKIIQNLSVPCEKEVFFDRYSHLISILNYFTNFRKDGALTISNFNFNGSDTMVFKVGGIRVEIQVVCSNMDSIKVYGLNTIEILPFSQSFARSVGKSSAQLLMGRKAHIYDYFKPFYRDVFHKKHLNYFGGTSVLDYEIYKRLCDE